MTFVLREKKRQHLTNIVNENQKAINLLSSVKTLKEITESTICYENALLHPLLSKGYVNVDEVKSKAPNLNETNFEEAVTTVIHSLYQ